MIKLSQKAHANKMMIKDLKLNFKMKTEKARPINDEKMNMIRSDAGKLAWLETGTAPLPSFQTSIALQGGKDNPKTIRTIFETREALNYRREPVMVTVTYRNLDFDTVHLRI